MDDVQGTTIAEGEVVTSLQPWSEKGPTPASVYLASLSSGSRKTMRAALRVLARLASHEDLDEETLPWHLLQYEHTMALRAQLIDHYAIASVHKILSGLRQVLKTAWRLGLMSAEDYQRASDIHDVKGEVIAKGRELAQDEVQALMTSCKSRGFEGSRDAALLALLLGAGLRRFESVGVDLADYDPKDTALKVRRGKGRKDRVTYLPPWARNALDSWLKNRGAAPGPLLCHARAGLDGKLAISEKRLSAGWVGQRVQEMAELAGVQNMTSHDFRRTFASALLARGVDIVTLQKLMGHGSITTTAGYDRRGEEAKKNAVEKLNDLYHDEKGT
jgi:site-specific recombinase XerD